MIGYTELAIDDVKKGTLQHENLQEVLTAGNRAKDLVQQILESLGYNVVTRTSSLEALELFKAQKGRFDLVITDLTMPQMTGEKLAGELMQIRPDIPVILCTGFSARIDEKKVMAMGVKAFVAKPILKRAIAETVRSVLDG